MYEGQSRFLLALAASDTSAGAARALALAFALLPFLPLPSFPFTFPLAFALRVLAFAFTFAFLTALSGQGHFMVMAIGATFATLEMAGSLHEPFARDLFLVTPGLSVATTFLGFGVRVLPVLP